MIYLIGGGELCIPNYKLLNPEHVAQLDVWLEKCNEPLPPLTEFILPGGARAAAQAHVCRTVCRRAERSIVRFGWDEPLYDAPRQYVNRLSDLLFVLVRILNRAAGGSDVLWKHEKKRLNKLVSLGFNSYRFTFRLFFLTSAFLNSISKTL